MLCPNWAGNNLLVYKITLESSLIAVQLQVVIQECKSWKMMGAWKMSCIGRLIDDNPRTAVCKHSRRSIRMYTAVPGLPGYYTAEDLQRPHRIIIDV